MVSMRPDPEEAHHHSSTTDEDLTMPDVPGSGVDLVDLIGSGGTGLVHSASQRSLGREVAVKVLRRAYDGPGAREMLVREARVIAMLGHPNIVPVHDLLWTDRGPQVVMKRISGRTWADLMANADATRALARGQEILDWHLDVFLAVCNAVAFAHTKGIIHRDLKPENVMVGEFGEVYVVDWGLAVRTDPAGDPRIPLASTRRSMAGTPAYMAPEMAGNGEIGRWTDIFLLGSILYSLVAGAPPYVGAINDELFERIERAEIVRPAGVPRSLWTVIAQAMAQEPANRFRSVTHMADVVREWHRRRGVQRIHRAAKGHLNHLLEALQTAESQPAHRHNLHLLHGSARFGFQEVLKSDPTHMAAQEGLRTATQRMAAYEVSRGDPDAADLLLSELHPPTSELVEAVSAARRIQQDQRRHVETLEMNALERDLDRGLSFRVVYILCLGVTTALIPWLAVIPFIGDGLRTSYLAQFVLTGSLFAMALGTTLLIRPALRESQANRNIAWSIVALFAAQIIFDIGCYFLDIAPNHTHVLHIFLWFCTALFLAITIDRRVLLSAIGYLVAFMLAANWPEYLPVFLSGGNVTLCLNALLVALVPARK